MTSRIARSNAAVLCLALMLGAASIVLAGPNDAVTRKWIAERADKGVGYGYWWGHGRWRDTGTPDGHCVGGCPSCTYWQGPKHPLGEPHDPATETQCTGYNQDGCYGADCSGYVAKCWDVGSRTDLDYDEDPRVIGTWNFYHQRIHWTEIDRSALRKGDALVWRNAADTKGHIVLYDGPGSGRNFLIWEAPGCSDTGIIVHWERYISNAYIAIRRNLVQDTPPCTPDSCNGNGKLVNGDCVCFDGYAGAECDRCARMYTGYPFCHGYWESCNPTDKIACRQTVRGDTVLGADNMTNYAPFCGNWGLDGREVVYEFRPRSSGTAHAVLSNMDPGDQDIMVLNRWCDNMACIEYGNTEAFFDFKAGVVYFLSVDTWAGYEGSFDLSLECDEYNPAWIGDVCTTDGAQDCDYTHPRDTRNVGYCYSYAYAQFCSLRCTKYCPDMLGKAETFCVENPASPGNGICVSKADDQRNGCCGDITGTTIQFMPRNDDPGTSAWVCMPE